MIKIVIDTNVFVSSLLGRQDAFSRKVIELVFSQDVMPLMGEALFHEYADVLNRDEIIKKSALTQSETFEILAAFMNRCQWRKIYYNWRPNLKDEGDNHIIELAIAGGAQYIVTKNIKDLKSGELIFNNLEVIAPEDFIKERIWE